MENDYREKIEQEKKHSEALLRNILPPEIAIRLRKGETNIADHFEDATIIFTDVVGFTKITARMRAFEIVSCLSRLFGEFDRLADDVGAEKIKTIGDSYMAAVGLPAPRPNHAQIASKLALDLVTAAQRLQSSLPMPFPIRVGVHSGPIMAGVIGTRKFAYDVWGDTVNIASRIEAARNSEAASCARRANSASSGDNRARAASVRSTQMPAKVDNNIGGDRRAIIGLGILEQVKDDRGGTQKRAIMNSL